MVFATLALTFLGSLAAQVNALIFSILMRNNMLTNGPTPKTGKNTKGRVSRFLKFGPAWAAKKWGPTCQNTYPWVCAWLCVQLLGTGALTAQSVPDTEYRPVHQIGIGLLGDAAVAALYYERLINVKPDRFLVAGKVGFGYNQTLDLCLAQSCGSQSTTYLAVPHHVTANFGEGRHFVELGAGGTYLFSPTNEVYVPYIVLGYRHRPLRTNKVGLRVYGCIPIAREQLDDISFFPLGLSLGYCF